MASAKFVRAEIADALDMVQYLSMAVGKIGTCMEWSSPQVSRQLGDAKVNVEHVICDLVSMIENGDEE